MLHLLGWKDDLHKSAVGFKENSDRNMQSDIVSSEYPLSGSMCIGDVEK